MPFDHFNAIAGLYERAANFQASPQFLQLLRLDQTERLLDVGGGTGRVAASLQDKVAFSVVADPARGMLKFAHQKGLLSICAPAENLPFSDHSFDRVIIMDAFHHVADQRKTAKELWRLLSPDGEIVIIEPDIHKFGVKLLALAEKVLLMRSHILSHEKIAVLFDEEGAVICVEQLGENQVVVLVRKP